MQFYYFSICHVCKTPTDLKKCSSCKVLHYCCRSHQLEDWPQHKTLCKAITKVCKLHPLPPNPTPSEFNNFKSITGVLWRYQLRRELEYVEQQMWMFPKVCTLCYSHNADLICYICQSVAYCSKEHQLSHRGSHERYCGDLKLCLRIHQALFKGEVLLPLECLTFSINNSVKTLPDSLQEVAKLLGYSKPSDYSKEHVNYILMCDKLCPAVNVINTLEKTGFVQNRQGIKTKLVVHFVGADHLENNLSWVLIFDFIAHWITNVNEIIITLIGPQVDREESSSLTLTCDIRIVTCTIIKTKGLYHDHVRFSHEPDIVVALNSGLHEFANDHKNDTWKLSIPELIRCKGVPLLLTAYTKNELNWDLARFEDVTFVTEQQNPFSNLRPIRNWEEGSDPVFHENGYFAIITKH